MLSLCPSPPAAAAAAAAAAAVSEGRGVETRLLADHTEFTCQYNISWPEKTRNYVNQVSHTLHK